MFSGNLVWVVNMVDKQRQMQEIGDVDDDVFRKESAIDDKQVRHWRLLYSPESLSASPWAVAAIGERQKDMEPETRDNRQGLSRLPQSFGHRHHIVVQNLTAAAHHFKVSRIKSHGTKAAKHQRELTATACKHGCRWRLASGQRFTWW
jgi:hypothetical protein